MPSWAIHLKVAEELAKDMPKEDYQRFLLGNLLPDVNVGYLINPISKKIPYSVTHYGKMETFDGKTREFPDYETFIQNLDPKIYYTDFDDVGSSNYAFVLMLREGNKEMFAKLVDVLNKENVEFRRGTAGGGNLLRQPFVRKRFPDIDPAAYKNAEYIHQFALYTGNYPELTEEKIVGLCKVLNGIK